MTARPRWDLAIVGASFAGLACAEAAARRGLRVLLLERKRDPGAGIHTTGLLTREAIEQLRPGASVLGARLDALLACTRGSGAWRMERAGSGFTTTDTPALLRQLAARTQAAGAVLRLGEPALLASAPGEAPCLRVGRDRLGADWIVAADGACSRVARAAGLPPPARLLAGAERHVEFDRGHRLDEDACLLLLDGAIAPGYAAWCVRGVHGAWQVGVLGRATGWRPDHALDAMLGWLRRRHGAVVRRVVETRGGLVPAGGALARPWRGRVVAVGDAAGHVSALTAGGIGRAALAGRRVGESLGLAGDPWQPALRALAATCGGWRLGAAWALGMACRVAPTLSLGALAWRPAAEAAAHVAFRETWTAPDAVRRCRDARS